MSSFFAGELLGKRARIEFPSSVLEISYSKRGDIHCKVTSKETGLMLKCTERASYLMLTDSLHFLNWKEKTGFTVSHLIDTEAGTVKAFWTAPELKSRNRASLFVEGRFEFV